MDAYDETLLDGLEGREREARRRLLEHLSSEGVPPAELAAAVREDRLALLPVDRVLGGRLTAAEIEARTGLPAILLLRFRRLLGLPDTGPDERVYGEEDIAAARATQTFIEAGITEGSIGEMVRVLGESMARLAGTTTAVFTNEFLIAGDTEQEVGARFAALAAHLTPAVSPVLSAAYLAHLRDAVRRGVLSRDEMFSGQPARSQDLTVCFADLVGFTRLGSQLELEELGGVASGFAALARELTEPPVQLVKMIGDAAMFVCSGTAPIVSVALRLVAAAEQAELPVVRAGLARGGALVRAGDFFGPPVNLASRVTGIARPGSVLCTEDVHEAAAEEFDWSFAGRHRLKGLPEPVRTWRARTPRPGPA